MLFRGRLGKVPWAYEENGAYEVQKMSKMRPRQVKMKAEDPYFFLLRKYQKLPKSSPDAMCAISALNPRQ
jgi:hypothetical protein